MTEQLPGLKTGLKAFQQGRRDLYLIDPRVIVIEAGFNARDFTTPANIAHVEFLKTSIIEVGLKEPLTVRLSDGKVTLVGGESRLRAILKAIGEGHEIMTVPCQADDRYTNDADRIAEIITRNSGNPLSPLEQASVVRRLIGFGWEQGKIAKKLSMSPSYVSHLLGLLTMPEEAQQMVRQGDVAAATASEAVRSHGDGAGVDVLREAVTEAKATGKKRASGSSVKKVGARRELTGKPIGITLSAVKTERVMTFLRWVLTRPETAALLDVRVEADKVMTDILK